MTIQTQSRQQLVNLIHEVEALSRDWDLVLNKSKSEILTLDSKADIEGIPCVTKAKYLGLQLNLDINLQRNTAKS